MFTSSSVLLQRIIVKDSFLNDTEALNHTFQRMSNIAILFFRVLSSFSLFFSCQKLNKHIAASEERQRGLTQYNEAQWWTQILVGQGSIQLTASNFVFGNGHLSQIKPRLSSSLLFSERHTLTHPKPSPSPVVGDGNLAALHSLIVYYPLWRCGNVNRG